MVSSSLFVIGEKVRKFVHKLSGVKNEKCQYEGSGAQDGCSSFSAVWFRDHGTKEKAESRVGGGTDEDVGGDGGGRFYAVTSEGKS